MVRPKLVQDGLFLVDDLVGDKILEINVFTPGGLLSIGAMYRADFVDSVVQALKSNSTSAAATATRFPTALSRRCDADHVSARSCRSASARMRRRGGRG